MTNIATTYMQTNGVIGTRSAHFNYAPNFTSMVWSNITTSAEIANHTNVTFNLLTSVTDFDGKVHKFGGFDHRASITSYVVEYAETNETNVVWFDSTWTQPRYWTNAAQEVTSFHWDEQRRLYALASPAGAARLFGWNPTTGLLDYVVDNVGGTNVFTWTNGMVRTVTDERGLTRTFAWDNLDRLSRVDYSSDGTSEEYSYVLENGKTNWTGGTKIMEPVRISDRNGNETRFAYTSLRRVETIVDAENHTTHFKYCGCGSLESIENAEEET